MTAPIADGPALHAEPGMRMRFRVWRRHRPFAGGLLTALGGIEMFFSGQLDVGKIHIQLGIEGLQATVIPILLVLLGVLAIAMPVHRIFYGVIALAVAVYSLVGVNLGGFFIGMLLSTVGGILTVAWMPKDAAETAEEEAEEDEEEGPAASTAATTTEWTSEMEWPPVTVESSKADWWPETTPEAMPKDAER